MNPQKAMFVGLVLSAVAGPSATGAVLTLFDYAFNVDGVLTSQAFPAGANSAGFDTGIGLGTVTVSVSGAGTHYVGMFVDHEIDEALNTYFNELGSAVGTPAVEQSWEIDEPGYATGDIYDNVTAGALDNAAGLSIYGDTTFPDDVSMALAYDFTLSAQEFALMSFTFGLQPPADGFYLVQTDPDSDFSIYFSGSLAIIPEPAAAWWPLACLSLAAVWASRWDRRRS